jgi:hypothetical protein
VKLRFLFVLSFLCLASMIFVPRAGSAQQVQPLEPEWLRQMYEEGWVKAQEGVLQRDTGGGQLETFSYGAEGLQWVIEGYAQQLSFLEDRYNEVPSEDLAGLIEKVQGEIDELSENLDASPSAEAFDGSALAECTEVAFGGDASAGSTQSPRGVTAAANAFFHTNCTGTIGDTFAVAYAEATDPATAVHTVVSQDDPLQGTWIDSSVTASAPGSTGCYSWGQASVTMNGNSVFQTPLKENYACPSPVQATITGPATVTADYYINNGCVNVTWTASATQGNPGYTYQWYIGTALQGSGTTLTKSYCNDNTSVTVRVVATDTQGGTDDATFTTDLRYVGRLNASVSGPTSAATNSSTPCVNVTWTASATGAHPGYSYSWYIGTAFQGTGGTFTKQYCNTSTSVTVKVVAQDSDGHTDNATKTTTITHTTPSPVTASISGPATVALQTAGECRSISWTASATGGTSGYTYTWYLGTSTTAAGTGSTLTKTFCGAQTINVKVVARDSGGSTDDATKTTTITNPTPVTASISGPTEVWIQTFGECRNISWTASATGGASGYTYTWYLGTSTTAAGTGSTLTKNFCGQQTIDVKVIARDTAAQTDDATFTTVIRREWIDTGCVPGQICQ